MENDWYFPCPLRTRVSWKTFKEVKDAVELNVNIDSMSHYVRVAILEKLRRDNENGRRSQTTLKEI